MPRRTPASILLLALLAAAGPGFADTLLTVRSRIEGLKMDQPASEIRIWTDGDKVRRDDGDSTYILRLDRKKLYAINHADKTYRELAFPVEPRKSATADSQVQLTATEETKKIGSWNARKYKLDIANPGANLHLDTTVWASREIASYQTLNRLAASLAALQPSSTELSRKLEQLDGFPVLQESDVQLGTSRFKTREELVSAETKAAPAGAYDPPAGYTAETAPK